MPEPFVANTRYNDYVGTIAIDGHDPDLLSKLAEQADISDEYRLIGFEMCNAIPDQDGSFGFKVVAARNDEVGHSVDDMGQYELEHGAVPVYRFRSHIKFTELLSLMQRLDIKVRIGVLKDANIVVETSEEARSK